MTVEPWKRVGPTVQTKIDRRAVILKTFRQPDGNDHVFGTFLDEDARSGGVIALTKEHMVIIARQFRPGPERIMYEIPGGGIETGEDPQEGVMRELREETGYTSSNITFLGTSCRDAYTNATWYYYLALDCEPTKGGQQLDEHEYVEVVLLTIEEFLDKARTDQMTDPAAVLMAYEKLKKLQEG